MRPSILWPLRSPIVLVLVVVLVIELWPWLVGRSLRQKGGNDGTDGTPTFAVTPAGIEHEHEHDSEHD